MNEDLCDGFPCLLSAPIKRNYIYSSQLLCIYGISTEWKNFKTTLRFAKTSIVIRVYIDLAKTAIVMATMGVMMTPIIVTPWYLKSPPIRLFVQQLVQANSNEHVTAPHHWPFVSESRHSSVDFPHKMPIMRAASSYNHGLNHRMEVIKWQMKYTRAEIF